MDQALSGVSESKVSSYLLLVMASFALHMVIMLQDIALEASYGSHQIHSYLEHTHKFTHVLLMGLQHSMACDLLIV